MDAYFQSIRSVQMESIKVIILDDDKATYEGLYEAKVLFDKYNFELIYYLSLEEAMNCLSTDSTFDFAIVDLALSSGQGDEGNSFINHLINRFNIYPIVYSGQPEKTTHKTSFIHKLTRGEHNSEDILNVIINLYSTGITTLLGENGTLQKHITNFYWDNLSRIYSSPQALIDSAIDPKALTRLYLNYLQNDLVSKDDNELRLHVDELYIIPQNESNPVNGSIVVDGDHRFIVVTPRCDIGRSDKYQLLKIGNIESTIKQLTECKPINQEKVHDRIAQGESEKKHYLPPSTNFEGGTIDFLDVHTFETEQLKSFKIIGKVSNEMMRNIISRFSSFYARQGQPIYKINFEQLLK